MNEPANPPGLDQNGHFAACRDYGCEITRCADARYMARRAIAERIEREALRALPYTG